MPDLQTIPTGDIDLSPDMDSWSSPPLGYQLLVSRVNTSTSSVIVGSALGTRTFTLSASGNQEWSAGGSVTAISGANSITGTVASYSSATQSLVMNVTAVSGSGTWASWTLEDLTSPYVLLIEDDGDKLLIE